MGHIIEIIFILIVLIIIGMNLILIVTSKKLKNISNETGLSGFEVARTLTNELAKEEPHIIKKGSKFEDYYDDKRNVIKLSSEVFDGCDIYAALIASITALETEENRINIHRLKKFNTYLVEAFYFLIIIGACTNNYNVINSSFLLFILTFILELIIAIKNKEYYEEKIKLIEKEEVIKPTLEYEKNLNLVIFLSLAQLPYGFIKYFK